MSNLPAWVIWLPLAGAAACWLVPALLTRFTAMAAAALTLSATLSLALQVWHRGPAAYPIAGYSAPLGIELMVDGLALWMLLLSGVTNALIGIYAVLWFPAGRPGFWPLWLLLWGGLNALALSADLFNLYVTLEIVSLCAVALVTLSEERIALTAATRYLLAAMLGSLTYLLGVALVYGEHGVLALTALSRLEQMGPASSVALVLLTIGLLLKTAVFPFHFWLPLAHASAPAPVSALLSALVVKASFYLLIRLWLFVFGALPLMAAAQVLGALGAAAVLYGSVQALRQERLKLLVAYSTVAQLGYLVLAMPLVIGTAPDVRALAYQGVAYHMMSHGLVKAALFLAAGVVARSYGHDRVAELKGMATRLPVTTFVIALAAASLIGLPPSGGFVAKWWLVSAALQGGQLGWGLTLLLGGLLSALYMFRLLAIGMPRGRPHEEPGNEPLALALPAFTLALAAVAIGLRSVELIELLHVGAPFDLFGGRR
ncbi:MAG: proton-conducting transporter membrane subunit [Trueperaceae bacterium]